MILCNDYLFLSPEILSKTPKMCGQSKYVRKNLRHVQLVKQMETIKLIDAWISSPYKNWLQMCMIYFLKSCGTYVSWSGSK